MISNFRHFIYYLLEGEVGVPVVELYLVLQQLFSRDVFEDRFQGLQSRFCAVFHIQPMEQFNDVPIQPKQPGR